MTNFLMYIFKAKEYKWHWFQICAACSTLKTHWYFFCLPGQLAVHNFTHLYTFLIRSDIWYWTKVQLSEKKTVYPQKLRSRVKLQRKKIVFSKQIKHVILNSFKDVSGPTSRPIYWLLTRCFYFIQKSIFSIKKIIYLCIEWIVTTKNPHFSIQNSSTTKCYIRIFSVFKTEIVCHLTLTHFLMWHSLCDTEGSSRWPKTHPRMSCNMMSIMRYWDGPEFELFILSRILARNISCGQLRVKILVRPEYQFEEKLNFEAETVIL